MKRPVCLYILVIGVLLQAGGNALLLLHYRLNTAYITEQYCENKALPELSCEGSCHLKKQLKQLDETTGNSQPTLKFSPEISWICQHLPLLQLQPQEAATTFSPTGYSQHYRSHSTDCPHQPPQRPSAA
jgi:hypothetical protein